MFEGLWWWIPNMGSGVDVLLLSSARVGCVLGLVCVCVSFGLLVVI